MKVQEGDQVQINLAPFIGSLQRNKEAIPCRVVAIDGPHIEVRTAHPFREFSLWVETTWIDSGEEGKESPSVTETLHIK